MCLDVAAAGFGVGRDAGCWAAGVGGVPVSVCVRVWPGDGRCARVLIRWLLGSRMSTACVATVTPIITAISTALITFSVAISPNNQEILEQFGGVDANSLCHLFNNTNLQNEYIDDEPEVMQFSSYHDDNSLNNIFKDKADSYSILSLNCQCLAAKFDQINIKVQQLQSKGFKFDAICLQETWLSDDSDTTDFVGTAKDILRMRAPLRISWN